MGRGWGCSRDRGIGAQAHPSLPSHIAWCVPHSLFIGVGQLVLIANIKTQFKLAVVAFADTTLSCPSSFPFRGKVSTLVNVYFRINFFWKN